MIKLINSYYDKETGTSYVEIATELGIFSGYAFLHPEDKNYESNYLGCEIAEYRATIQYLEKKLYRLNVELKLLEKIITFNGDNTTKLYLVKTNNKKQLLKNIKQLKDIIKNKAENRIIIIDKLNEIKNKKEDSK